MTMKTMIAAMAVVMITQIQNKYHSVLVQAMTETHRMEEYKKRGYKWPLEGVIPNTPGWNRIMKRRFEQMERVQDENKKYNGWLSLMTSAILTTNYTENGWGLTRAPEHITKRLQERLYNSIEVSKMEVTSCENDNDDTEQKECVVTGEKEIVQLIVDDMNARQEHFVEVIEAEEHARPIMIPDEQENQQILEEMKPMFEWWSGLDLEGSIAYGIRAYRNDSNLLMHADKPNTHVISGIYHVGRSEDAEPWPIVIEDFQGNSNQVYLEPGDVLFYESSKCFHGRPQTFVGSYYASLFMHYRPVGYEMENNEIHYAVPAHWHAVYPLKEGLDELVMVGTSFKEPGCKNLLCSIDESHDESRHLVNWYGPAPTGQIVTTGWDSKTMTPPKAWKEEQYDGGKRDASDARRVLYNDNNNMNGDVTDEL